MKKLLFVLLAAISINSSAALAGEYTDALSKCLANATTGKDRTDLARWIFFVMAAHPDVGDLSVITPEKKDQINQTTGVLFTRLLSTCSKEVKEADKHEGEASTKTAFEFLGGLAMQELMSNPKVETELRGFVKYADLKKIRAAYQ